MNIGQVTNLNSYQFDVTYDKSVIQVIGDEGGAGVSPGLINSTQMPIALWGYSPAGSPGHVGAIGLLRLPNTVTGQGYLAQISFQVVGASGKVSPLTLSKVKLFDANGNPIATNFTIQSGSVTVQ